MTRYRREGQVTDEYTRLVPGATIFVFDQNGNDADLTSDEAGLVPLVQPVETDEFGAYAYYANASILREDTYYGGKLRYREVLPVGLDGLYPPGPRAGLFFAFDADGNPIAASGTGADAGLRTDLALASGSSLLSYLPAATGIAGLSLQTALRVGLPIRPHFFGTVADGVANDLAALQACCDWYFNDATIFRDYALDLNGNFGVAGKLTIGPSAFTSGDRDNLRRYDVRGDLRLTQLTSGTFVTCELRNLGTTTWNGDITAQGYGGRGNVSFASRTCGIGILLTNCAMARFNGQLKGYNFWLWGVFCPSTGTQFNDEAGLNLVRCLNCGSGVPGSSLTANWSAPANSGVTASSAQRTTLTVDALPNASIETYETVGTAQIQVRIAGYTYYVYSWDRTASTITIYPWLDNTSVAAGTGTLEYVIGGAFGTLGGDSGIMQINHIYAGTCGRGLGDGAAYGTRVNSIDTTSCGAAVTLGNTPGTHIGTSIDALYPEGCQEDVVSLSGVNNNAYSYINSTYAISLAKCWQTGEPRNTAGAIVGGAFGSGGGGADPVGASLTLAAQGIIHTCHQRPLNNLLTTNMTYRGQTRPPRIVTQNRNSQTIALTVQDTSFNRLFGYQGSTLRYIGTGTNGAPTGSFTFTPPAGGTVNGGAVDGSAVFSAFTGPVDFEVCHIDPAQLTWIVRVVAGQQVNGTITPNVQAVASSATVTPTFSNDQVDITAQAVALALANPTGTAVPDKTIRIRIKDNGTARAITYGTQYRAIGATLPTTTVINKTVYLTGIWNATDTKLDIIHVAQEA